jgi:hypothetical protein
VPAGTDSSKPHKDGWLWVPASANANGYAQAYFDDAKVGPLYTWRLYQPGDSQGQTGPQRYAAADRQHLQLIVGTGTANPMTVYGVSVWQRPGAMNNLGSAPLVS